MNPAIDYINEIYDHDIRVKKSRDGFVQQSFQQKHNPFAGVVAHMMYNGTALLNPNNEDCHIGTEWDYAPGLEPYVGRDICIKIAEKIQKMKYPICRRWLEYQINFKASSRYQSSFIPAKLIGRVIVDLKNNLVDIMKTHPHFIFTGMFMEHRVRNPNCCFPKEPQTRIDYIQTIYHFLPKKAADLYNQYYGKEEKDQCQK